MIFFKDVQQVEGVEGVEEVPANPAPSIHEISVETVLENAPNGYFVGTVLASDPDAGDTVTYALTDDAGGRFALDPTTGVISVADGSLLDYESADQPSITVEVTDASGLSHSLTTVIGVSSDNSGNDALSGDDADNVIDGGAGDDVMSGGGGNDQLSGGSGNDTLSGGSGADRFVFDGADQGLDTITDFGTGDVLVFTDLAGFTAGHEAEYVSLIDDGSKTTVLVDVDGAANGSVFDPVAVLNGVTGTSLTDLVNARQIDLWATS
jgi:Ca2+-binding RTX toxin-like protein